MPQLTLPSVNPVFAANPPNLSPFVPPPNVDEEAKGAAKKAALAVLATVTAVTVATRLPKTTAYVTTIFTGFRIEPGVGVKATPGVILFAAPQPIGIVPPRVYGLPPEMANPANFWRAVSEPGGQRTNQEMVRARQQAEWQRTFAQYAAGITFYTDEELARQLRQSRQQPFTSEFEVAVGGAIVEETRRRAIARGDEIGPQFEDRGPGDQIVRSFGPLVPTDGPTSPLAAPVPSASIQPEAITPVNDTAKRNADSAKGIRQQLVHERADP